MLCGAQLYASFKRINEDLKKKKKLNEKCERGAPTSAKKNGAPGVSRGSGERLTGAQSVARPREVAGDDAGYWLALSSTLML